MQARNVRALCAGSVLGIVGLCGPPVQAQTTCYVDDSQTVNPQTGVSWNNAYTDLQNALDDT